MAPTRAPGGSGGGGGGNVPLINWMLGLDASGAMGAIADMQKAMDEAQEKMAARAKTFFPSGVFDVISKGSKDAFGEMARNAAAAAKATELALGDAKKAAEKLEAKLEAGKWLKTAATVGLGVGVLGTRSLISQGMASSGQGATSAFYNEQLARQVAGVFAPITEENTQRVAELTNWFRQLTGAQQESLRTMGMFIATTGVLLRVLPEASSNMATFMGASASTAKAFGIAGVVASVGIGLMASSPGGRAAMTDMAKALGPAVDGLAEVVKSLTPLVAGFAKGIANFLQWRPPGGTQTVSEMMTNSPAQPILNPAYQAGSGVRAWIRARLGLAPEAGGGPEQSRSELHHRANGFEMPVDTWERLNAAAQTIELAQQTADNTAQIVQELRQMREGGMGLAAENAIRIMRGMPQVVD